MTYLNLPQVHSMGIKTLSGEILIGGAPIGSTVTLRNLSGQMYRILNTSETPLKIEVSITDYKGTLTEGTEVLPDTKWVSLSQYEFNLAPGQEGYADVTITLPDDPSLMGRRFIAHVHARTVPQGEGVGISVGLKSKLFVSVSTDRLTPEQKKKAEEIKELLRFEVSPMQIELTDFPKGEAVDVTVRYKKGFKLLNINDNPFKVKVEIVDPSDAFIQLKESTAKGKAAWVDLSKNTFSIEPNSIYQIPLKVNIPKEIKEKRFIFVVKMTLLDYDVPVSHLGRLFINTK
ncbi:MAG: hypothetical protein AABZ44_07245 [Elusimicrobiota bacterium]